MKPKLIDLDFILTGSFMIKEIVSPYFTNSHHFHKDYELVLVLESNGKRIIGDHIGNFKKGDLVFVGPSLPHAWFNDKEYYEENMNLSAKSIVTYFKTTWLKNEILALPETTMLNKLLENAKRGMKLKGKTRDRITSILVNIPQSKGLKKSVDIYTILYELSETSNYELLASANYVNSYNENEADRINQVYEYVMKNFSKAIKLSDISDIVHLSTSAFCKYFKARTQKNFSHFVNEIRISHACRLLQKEDFPISQICFESGFQSTTNFNKAFKKIMNKSPIEYRKELKMNSF